LPAYVAWRAGTTTLFPIDCFKIPAQDCRSTVELRVNRIYKWRVKYRTFTYEGGLEQRRRCAFEAQSYHILTLQLKYTNVSGRLCKDM
jgi:hypothetical protein